MIVAVVIDDGRPEYLRQTVDALDKYVTPIDFKILINDSGDDSYTHYLVDEYPLFDVQVHHPVRRGLGGAVKSAWETALEHGADYVWHQEDDQAILSDIDLRAFIALLESQPHLAQVAIKRTAYSSQEHAAGGIVEVQPHVYTEYTENGMTWIESEQLFVFCPSLIPRCVIEIALANGTTFIEDNVTEVLWAQGYRSCFWGAMYDPPLCDHIGIRRSAGYHW